MKILEQFISATKKEGDFMMNQQNNYFRQSRACIFLHKEIYDCTWLGLFDSLISNLKPSEIPH